MRDAEFLAEIQHPGEHALDAGLRQIQPARPTSLPVPAVVGTATTGAMPLGSARVHQSSMSSKSHNGRVCPDMNAMTLPASRPEPPPNATTPSWAPAW